MVFAARRVARRGVMLDAMEHGKDKRHGIYR